MAKYRMETMPDLRGNGATPTYPRMVHEGVVTTDKLAEDLQARSTFTTGDIKGLLATLSEYIAEQTAQGYSLKIDGLGTFSATLALAEGKEREVAGGTRRNAQSICLRSIKFRPDKELLKSAQKELRLERDPTPQRELLLANRDERLSAALAFIEQEGFLRVADYVALTGLSRTMATSELRAFHSQRLLGIRGRGTHKVYVKA